MKGWMWCAALWLGGFSLCSAQNKAAANPLVEVTIAPLQQVQMGVLRSAPATVRSLNEATLSAEVQASVTQVLADVGAEVKKGAPLITLDDRDYVLAVSAAKAAEAAAEADVALAQARLNRANSLKPKNYVSVDEAAQVAAALKSAEAQRALRRAERGQAELRLTRTTLRAPFDAIVLKRDAQVGMLANVGTPLVTLIDRGGVEIAATVEANQVLSLRQAPEVQFRANGEPVPVLIKRISAALDRGTRTAEARLQFAGFAAPIGSEGRIEWRDAEALLPAEYLTRRDGALGVFWFDGKVARFEPLPAAQEGRPTAVSLPPTAAIIVRGRQGLRDGQAVSIAR